MKLQGSRQCESTATQRPGVARWHQAATILALVGALALVAACGGSDDHGPEEEEPPPAPDPIGNERPYPAPSNLNCPNGTYLTYENFGEGFLLNYCTICHSAHLAEGQRAGAPTGVDFDTPDAMRLWRSRIIERALGLTPDAPMPPGQNISAVDRELLTEWLNCGAPSGEARIK